MTNKRHSEAVLSDLRDDWWSQDYLELCASRLGLSSRVCVLDVGCGQGHWGQRLLPLLHPEATLVGVDQERDWIAHAKRRADALYAANRCTYQQAKAESLPFAANGFDLVTCQTLVMHVASPKLVLREMLRVLRPGGLLLLAEPSNLPNQFSTSSLNRSLSPEELAELAYLFTCCSRGRANLGRGDDSIADVLPDILRELELTDLRIFQNERTSSVIPPYSESVAAQLAQELGHASRKFWLWNRDDACALFEAGGGAPERFAAAYEVFQLRDARFREQVEAGTYSRIGGGHHYLIAGRLPD